MMIGGCFLDGEFYLTPCPLSLRRGVQPPLLEVVDDILNQIKVFPTNYYDLCQVGSKDYLFK